MCYRTATASKSALKEYLDNYTIEDYPEFYQASGHAHPPLPVLKADTNLVVPIQWGIKPFWPTSGFPELSKHEGQTLNTQAEHAFRYTPPFPGLHKRERCLAFIGGFYEFRHEEPEKKSGPKTAYYIYHPDKTPLAIPSLVWTWVHPDTAETIETISLLTTKANELMSHIHNTKLRMPAVMDKEGWEHWLDQSQPYKPPAPYRDGGLSAHPVANFLKKGMDQNCAEMQLPLNPEPQQQGLF